MLKVLNFPLKALPGRDTTAHTAPSLYWVFIEIYGSLGFGITKLSALYVRQYVEFMA